MLILGAGNLISGSFKLDKWKDRTSGEFKTKPVVRVDRLELLGSKRDSEANAFNKGNNDAGGMQTSNDIPF